MAATPAVWLSSAAHQSGIGERGNPRKPKGAEGAVSSSAFVNLLEDIDKVSICLLVIHLHLRRLRHREDGRREKIAHINDVTVHVDPLMPKIDHRSARA